MLYNIIQRISIYKELHETSIPKYLYKFLKLIEMPIKVIVMTMTCYPNNFINFYPNKNKLSISYDSRLFHHLLIAF